MLPVKIKLKILEKLSSTINYDKITAYFFHLIRKIAQPNVIILSFFEGEDNLKNIKQWFSPESKPFASHWEKKALVFTSYYHDKLSDFRKRIALKKNTNVIWDKETQDCFHLLNAENLVFFPFCKENEKSHGVLQLITLKSSLSAKHLQELDELIEIFFYPVVNAIKINKILTSKKDIEIAQTIYRKIYDFSSHIKILLNQKKLYSMMIQELLHSFGFEVGLVFLEKNKTLQLFNAYSSNHNHNLFYNQLKELYEKHPLVIDDNKDCNSIFIKTFTTAQIFHSDAILKEFNQNSADSLLLHYFPHAFKNILCLPIFEKHKPMGVFFLASCYKKPGLNPEDIHIIKNLIDFIPSITQNHNIYTLLQKQKKNLVRKKKELEKLNHQLAEKTKIMESKNYELIEEMKLAQQIHYHLIPNSAPNVEGLKFSLFYKPMKQLGGDFYDFIHFRERDVLGIFICDISGHGIPAALIATMLKTILNSSGQYKLAPATLLNYINSKLKQDEMIGNYLTAFYGIYRVSDKTFRYSRASHPYPILIRDKTLFYLEGKGNLLGMFEEIDVEEKEIILQNKDKLIFYTDGLIEASNPAGQLFKDKLADVLLLNAHKPINELLNIIYKEMLSFCEDFHTQDDVCVLGMEID